METDAQRYKRLADDAMNTTFALYIVGGLLLLVTMGAAFPIAFVLFGIGQCVFGAKHSKYMSLAEQHGYKREGWWEKPLFED